MMLFNQPLLVKWLWPFAIEKDALWRKVVECKYAYGSIVDWDGVIFPDASIGNGTNAQFWVDWWCEDGILKNVF